MNAVPAAKPTRPKITAHRESIVPEFDNAAPPIETSTRTHANKVATVQIAPPKTTTVSVRVPEELAEEFATELRRLHFTTGASKGAVAAAMLRSALDQAGTVEASLKS